METREEAVDLLLDEGEILQPDLEEGEVLDEIIQESSVSEFGPPLCAKVNTVVGNFMNITKVSKGSTDKLKAILCPEGAEFLGQTRVNDEIYPLLPGKLKKDNSEFLKIESSICKSVVVQPRLITQLLELKKLIPAGQAGLVNNMVRDLAGSIEVQGFGRLKLNELRRDNIVAALNSEFSSLVTATSPGDGKLFGKGLGETLREIEASNKLTVRLSSFDRLSSSGPRISTHNGNGNVTGSFLGRGRGGRSRHRFQRTYGRNSRLNISGREPDRRTR